MAVKEIKRITIEGTSYPFSVGVNSTALYCEMHNIDLLGYYEHLISMLTGKGSPAVTRDIIFCCLKDGCRKEKIEFKHDNLWVGDIMDDIGAEGVAELLEAITESLPKKDTDTEAVIVEIEEPKKKALKK